MFPMEVVEAWREWFRNLKIARPSTKCLWDRKLSFDQYKQLVETLELGFTDTTLYITGLEVDFRKNCKYHLDNNEFDKALSEIKAEIEKDHNQWN